MSKTRLGTVLGFILILTTSVSGLTRIVPIAGHTEGAYGTFWRTDLLLSNSVNHTQVVDLTFWPVGAPPVTRAVILAPSDTMLIEDVANPISFGSSAASWTGQLTVDSPHGLHATAHTFTTSPLREGTYGGVTESYDPLVIPAHGTLTGLNISNRFRSNVAFANGVSAVNAIEFSVRGSAGQVIATRRLELAAHETRQLSFIHDLGLGDGVYSLEWASSLPALAVASVIDNVSGDPSNAPSIANARTAYCFPIVGRTEGAMETSWNTALSITTESSSGATVSIAYHGADETNAVKTVAIEAKGTFSAADLLTYLGVSSGVGYLHLASDAPIVTTVRIFNTEADGATYGSLLLPQEPVVESDEIRIRGVRRTSQFRANVVLTNRTMEPTAGWLRFFDSRGNVVEKHWFVLKAHDMTQIALNGSIVDVEAGEVEVRTGDGVHVLAIVSNIDNASGDTIVREAEQELARQLEP